MNKRTNKYMMVHYYKEYPMHNSLNEPNAATCIYVKKSQKHNVKHKKASSRKIQYDH